MKKLFAKKHVHHVSSFPRPAQHPFEGKEFKYQPEYKGKKPVVEIDNLVLSYANPARPKEKNLVIRGSSVRLYENEILALIGESGSGKSVITSAMYGLAGENAVIEEGTIKILGKEVQSFSSRD